MSNSPLPTDLRPLPSTPDLVEQVYRRLQDAIASGQLAPGQRVTQEELAGQLVVSRQPVLQALRLLKKDGLLRDAPGRGLLVAPLDVQRIGQVYDVRQALDGLAVRLAAERRAPLPDAVFSKGREAFASGDIGAMIDADMAFHMAVYEASGNPLIADSAALHWQHLRRAMGVVLQSHTILDTVWDEHEAIATAIAQGQAETALTLVQQHSQRARDNLTARLNRLLHPTPPPAPHNDLETP
ncbi:GntR family transcriptional regulator [Curvibacter sp. RS43]|uniref:GntR family transcriptional regulator n=1 Tax=Curvibacter microcysteis TaxID=3026419 RepID=UPI00235EFBF5|nr:GntR family transcriptional regulator [Curvibacter sp. RS43]MDD0810618.1 GntR family transcriptional regulator [Curvibacter sp. RS43]